MASRLVFEVLESGDDNEVMHAADRVMAESSNRVWRQDAGGRSSESFRTMVRIVSN